MTRHTRHLNVRNDYRINTKPNRGYEATARARDIGMQKEISRDSRQSSDTVVVWFFRQGTRPRYRSCAQRKHSALRFECAHAAWLDPALVASNKRRKATDWGTESLIGCESREMQSACNLVCSRGFVFLNLGLRHLGKQESYLQGALLDFVQADPSRRI